MSILDDHDAPDLPAARRGLRSTSVLTDVGRGGNAVSLRAEGDGRLAGRRPRYRKSPRLGAGPLLSEAGRRAAGGGSPGCERKVGRRTQIEVILADCPEGVEDAARQAAVVALRAVGCSRGCLEIAFVGDAAMRRLHKRWLGKDGTTDVISFDLREQASAGIVDGQLVVCRSVARRRARPHGQDWRSELLLYIVHGCLHLGGLDDQSAASAARMHQLEDRILTRLGWGAVYSGRGASSEVERSTQEEQASARSRRKQPRRAGKQRSGLQRQQTAMRKPALASSRTGKGRVGDCRKRKDRRRRSGGRT